MAETEEKQSFFGRIGSCLGWCILFLAIAAVVFFFFVKPRLEERGVDVDSKLDALKSGAEEVGGKVADGARQGVAKVKERAPEVVEQAKAAWQNGKAKAADAADAAQESAGAAKEKAADVAEVVRDGAETVEDNSSEWVD